MQTFLFLQILHLTSLSIYVGLIIFLITNYQPEQKSRLAIILLSLLAWWSFCKIFVHNFALSFEIVNFFDKLMSIAWLFFPAFLLLLSFSFSTKPIFLKNSILKVIIFIPPAIFLLSNFLGYLSEPVKNFEFYWNSSFKKNIFAFLFYLYFILYTVIFIFILSKLKKETQIKYKIAQLNLLIRVTVLLLSLIILFEIIFPVILNLEPNPLFDILNVYFLIFAFSIFYFLTKYQFLGISPIKTFDTIISNMSEFLFVLDEEFNFSFINLTALNSLEYNFEELKNKPLGTIIYSSPDFNKLLKTLIIKKSIKGYDLSLKTKSGKILPVYFYAKIFEDQYEIKVICIAVDITEKIKLTEYLQKQRDLAEKYLNIAPVIFLILNREGKIIFLNENGMKILGVYTESEFLNKNWFEEFIPEEEKDSLKSYFLKFINEKTILKNFENFILTKNGEKKLIRWSNTILKDKENKIYGVLSAGIDITEEKEAEKALKESFEKLKELNKLKDNFLSIISHELRTPLTSIIGFISLMRGGAVGKLNSKQLEFLEIMKNNSDRLLSLITDLLDISKIESGKLQLSFSQIDLIFLIKSIIVDQKSLLQKKQIVCDFNTEFNVLLINADKLRIMQIITNILNNAIKFSLPNSKILIKLKKIDSISNEIPERIRQNINSEVKFVLISITDHGVGLTQKQIENLFQKFYQTEDANTRKAQGTGLGLYIAKNLIELHNGFVWAVSEGPNKGSTFNILLPL